MSLIIQYVSEMIPYCLGGMIICAIIRAKHYSRKRTKQEFLRELLILLFAAYCAGVASQKIIPRMDFGIYSDTGKPYFKVFWNTDLASVNLIPFKTLWAQLTGNNSYVDQSEVNAVSTMNLLSNVFLFCPLGVFLPLLWSKFRGTTTMIAAAIVVSTCVEIIQLFIGRTCDIDDVILNSLGILIGFGVYKFIQSIRKKPVRNT